MKVKTWHIGCLVVLIAAALYFLLNTHEGLVTPPATPDLNGTWKVNSTDYDGKITQYGDTWTLTPSSTKSGWTSVNGKFDPGSSSKGTMVFSTPGGPLNFTFTLDSSGNTITANNGGSFTRVSTPQAAPIPPGPTGTTGGASMTPPVSAPMPPGPTGTTGGASMTPPTVPTPFPTPSSASAPSYSLTCTASPVSGMVGSAAAMPETPAAWNVTQPPSGWNSKNGYTTTGN